MTNRFMTSGDRAPRGDRRTELRLLGSVPTLGDAPGSLLKAMLDAGYVVNVRPDWPLLTEGTAPDKAYVLLDGMIYVHRNKVGLGDCRPGEILGELGIVRRRLRSATVVTASPVTVLQLSREAFEELYAEQPYFRDLVGEAVTRKVA